MEKATDAAPILPTCPALRDKETAYGKVFLFSDKNFKKLLTFSK